ncbi:MAG: STAS domain-containing protein [Ignavibacteriaceae bacterium]
MNFSKETAGDVLIEKINIKRATAAEADEFRDILLNDIETGWRRIVIDFEDNSFIDSTFLGAIVTVLRTLSKLGGDLKISSVHGDVKNILDLTGSFRVLSSFDTKEEAVLSFQNKQRNTF